jgi:hypothetical protein
MAQLADVRFGSLADVCNAKRTLPPKADIQAEMINVCFVPIGDIAHAWFEGKETAN